VLRSCLAAKRWVALLLLSACAAAVADSADTTCCCSCKQVVQQQGGAGQGRRLQGQPKSNIALLRHVQKHWLQHAAMLQIRDTANVLASHSIRLAGCQAVLRAAAVCTDAMVGSKVARGCRRAAALKIFHRVNVPDRLGHAGTRQPIHTPLSMAKCTGEGSHQMQLQRTMKKQTFARGQCKVAAPGG
jgi:hypothetical protein